MAKDKPISECPEWAKDGPRYLVSMETQNSCPGTKVYKGFFQTDKLDDALLECATAAKEEGKETIVWDRWEFITVLRETPTGVVCDKPTKKTRKFLPVTEIPKSDLDHGGLADESSAEADGSDDNGTHQDGYHEQQPRKRKCKRKR